jgi:hypothetical protein
MLDFGLWRWRRKRGRRCLVCCAVAIALLGMAPTFARAATDDDTAVAMRLAELLRSARTVISRNQGTINDPEKGDKGLTGDKVLADTIALLKERTGDDPRQSDAQSLEGKLLRAEMDSIAAVMNENQATINAKGVGFKGFIPAVFARLVNEKFADRVGDLARIKATAPENLVRNRKARPDAWESAVIEDKFLKADWPKGKPYSELAQVDGKPAFRIVVPEYYAASCLSCHGEPAGEMDVTGYPKEGGKEGDLGAAISITLFK